MTDALTRERLGKGFYRYRGHYVLRVRFRELRTRGTRSYKNQATIPAVGWWVFRVWEPDLEQPGDSCTVWSYPGGRVAHSDEPHAVFGYEASADTLREACEWIDAAKGR